jgi:hypothetical protein
MKAPPKFAIIRTAREKLTNDQSENDCRSFKFPINLDLTPYAYDHWQRFRYQLGAVVAHVFCRSLVSSVLWCRNFGKFVFYVGFDINFVHADLEGGFAMEKDPYRALVSTFPSPHGGTQ